MPAKPSDAERSDPETPEDIEPDDGDNEWEDLPGLGTSTHRSRNPTQPVIPIRKRRRQSGKNTRSTAVKRRTVKLGRMQRLAEEMEVFDAEREERAKELSDKHGIRLKEVRRRMMASSCFATRRRVSLYNAKIVALTERMNEDLEVGERYNLRDVKKMAKADPSLLQGFSKEEEEEMVEEAVRKRELKHRGAHANNLAAGADAKRTIERLMQEMIALADRAGMIGFAMFTRGHLHDTTAPVTIDSGGALNFFREVLRKDPADMTTLFELWAVGRERGSSGADTLVEMQKQCTEMIKTGLVTASGKTKIAMNFESYINALVEGQNLGLLGWPEGVVFKRMSKQSAIGPLRTLRDALRSGTCRWKLLTPSEKARVLKEWDEMVERGDATDNGPKPKRARKEAPAPRTTRKAPSRAATKKKTREASEEEASENGDHGDSHEDSGDEEGPSAAKGGKAAAIRKRLLALVRAKETQAKKGSGKRKTRHTEDEAAQRKRKRRAESGGDEERSRKRKATTQAANTGDEERGRKRKANARDEDTHGGKRKDGGTKGGSKRKRAAEEEGEEEEEGRVKKRGPGVASKSASTPKGSASRAKSPARAAPAVERPRPRPILKKVAPAPDAPAPPDASPNAAPAPNAPAPPNAAPNAPPAPNAPAPPDTPPAPKPNTVKGKRGGPPGTRPVAPPA
ncbi:hypothetical protein B0H11DRAFT_2249551 [Mycena galericulata]|nr:hypothetical protein B0H11DRAFT_2249551 [Mycena galericulata]